MYFFSKKCIILSQGVLLSDNTTNFHNIRFLVKKSQHILPIKNNNTDNNS